LGRGVYNDSMNRKFTLDFEAYELIHEAAEHLSIAAQEFGLGDVDAANIDKRAAIELIVRFEINRYERERIK
jgi:hypothetical protein